MKKIKNFMVFIFYVVSIAFIFWIFASWIDINKCNSIANDNYRNYAEWNLFINMEENTKS